MSIVKSLVLLLASEIKVDSKLGKGTKVTVITLIRLCNSDQSKTGKLALDLERCIASLCREHLFVVLFGFLGVICRAFKKYLREQFNCTLLESVNYVQPDVVLVEEGNDEVASNVESTALRYS